MNKFDRMPYNFNGSNPDDEDSAGSQDCPVMEQANIALKSSEETRQDIRLLREALLDCSSCPEFSRCELQEKFSLQIDLVIAEINEEWGW
jgi:hypothetical protein